MRLFFRTCVTAIVCVSATAATARTITTAIDLPTGAVISLNIEKRGERSGVALPSNFSAIFRYRQTIVSTEEGYIVTQTLTGMDAPPEARAILEEAAGALKEITFETDASLSPLKLRDREAVLDKVFGSMTAVLANIPGADADAEKKKMDAAASSAKSMFAGLSDEQLARTMLKEQVALSELQSMEFDFSEPIEEVVETPSPAGGPPFKRSVSIKLEKFDEKAERATIATVDVVDPEALKAGAITMLQRLAPDQREKITSELTTAKMEMRKACLYEMDLKTGLAARTDCTQTVTALGSDGKLSRKVDQMIITQTLTLP